jgi:hypothetical protein
MIQCFRPVFSPGLDPNYSPEDPSFSRRNRVGETVEPQNFILSGRAQPAVFSGRSICCRGQVAEEIPLFSDFHAKSPCCLKKS